MSNTEKMGYKALRARLVADHRTNEVEMLDLFWSAVRKHPIGSVGLNDFVGNVTTVAEKINRKNQYEMSLDSF